MVPETDARCARSRLDLRLAGGTAIRWRLGYDPGIAVPFRAQAAPLDLWPLWDAVRCSTLVLRGADSDLLSARTAEAMAARGPRARVVEIAEVGHAPMLMDPYQIELVAAFLRAPEPR